jgi:hypothetical protein
MASLIRSPRFLDHMRRDDLFKVDDDCSTPVPSSIGGAHQSQKYPMGFTGTFEKV